MIEDVADDALLVAHRLGKSGRTLEIERVEDADAMRAALARASWDLILCDWNLPDFDAARALAIAKEMRVEAPFIVVSGTVGEEAAAEIMRAGANDFILKDRLARLVPAVERALRETAERKAAEATLQRTEEQLRQAQKMDALGRLAGGVAHDFNNLLSVILSYGELVLDELAPDASVREDVHEIIKAGQRASELTRQLLLFSRKQPIEPRVVDLNDTLSAMGKMLQRILGADVEIVSIPAADLGTIRVDPGSIEQVILNLVVNARDAMPTGGKLTMETANVSLDEDFAREHAGGKPGPHVMLAVSDTGFGMDAATQARIFEPFFTTKDRSKGTGLGLSTVFGIVRQSGGSISVESEPGKGTRFAIHLPRVDAPAEPARSTDPPPTLLGTETILLVEDDDQLRTLARNVLQRNGYRILEANHPRDALLRAGLHAGPIHLLLSDVVLPEMSGPELARRLAMRRPEVRVLCMSGYTDDSIVRHGVLHDRLAYLPKPITPDALARKVREVLDAP